MKKKLFIFMMILLPITIPAALPPYYASVREIKEIVDSDELHSLLGSGQRIDSLEQTEGGWIVISGERFVTVKIHYDFPQPGRGNLKLEFQKSP